MTDKSKSTETSVNVRRSALKKIVGGSVVGALTLAHRPAMGAVCLPSGHISSATHVSAMLRHGEAYDGTKSSAGGCGGLSEGAWSNPYNGSSSSWASKDGGPSDWLATGYIPNKPPIITKGNGDTDSSAQDDWYEKWDPTRTDEVYPSDFGLVFNGSSSGLTLEDAVTDGDGVGGRGNDLERVATMALLNALLFGWTGIDAVHPADVIGLYDTVTMGDGKHTLVNGSLVKFDEVELYNFFKGLIH